ncbi:MAG: hypothetical protein ACOC3X_01295 [Nanoarchaeota archaeon]
MNNIKYKQIDDLIDDLTQTKELVKKNNLYKNRINFSEGIPNATVLINSANYVMAQHKYNGGYSEKTRLNGFLEDKNIPNKHKNYVKEIYSILK